MFFGFSADSVKDTHSFFAYLAGGSTLVEVSQFSLGMSCEVFILGKPLIAQQLGKALATLPFLIPVSPQSLLQARQHLHLVIAPCDFTKPRELQTVARSLLLIKNPLAYKILYSLSPQQLSMDELLFGAILQARFTAFGPEREARLKAYLKSVVLHHRQHASLQTLERQLSAAIAMKNHLRIKHLYRKLNTCDKESYLTLQLKARACAALGQFSKSLFFLKQMLAHNPQDLWAINALTQQALQTSGSEPLQLVPMLAQASDYGASRLPATLNDSRVLACLDALGIHSYPDTVTHFLETHAELNLTANDYKHALAFLGLALHSCGQAPSKQARLFYQMGLAYLKAEKYTEAQNCLQQSVAWGGAKYKRAIQTLAASPSPSISKNIDFSRQLAKPAVGALEVQKLKEKPSIDDFFEIEFP